MIVKLQKVDQHLDSLKIEISHIRSDEAFHR